MQVLKGTNTGFVCLQRFISRLQKEEILSTKVRTTKQSISFILSILDCFKQDWSRNDMNLSKNQARQFSFLAIGGMLFWISMTQLLSLKTIPTEVILKVFGDTAENQEERWLVNGFEPCERMTINFIRELRRSTTKMDLSCTIDIEKLGLSFQSLLAQVVHLQVQA